MIHSPVNCFHMVLMTTVVASQELVSVGRGFGARVALNLPVLLMQHCIEASKFKCDVNKQFFRLNL